MLVTLGISEWLVYNYKWIGTTMENQAKKLTIETLGLACMTESITA
jgi:hypothetical protein